ncbi:hypothetical protein HER39_15330, partial [Arthrobacter deserti]|nr:hypothetical protein [Arthrobacter deserti]
VYDGFPTEIRVLERHSAGSVPASSELDLALVNVAAANIDLTAAGFAAGSQVRLQVTTGGPTTLHLHGDGRPRHLDLDAGTHDVLFG